MGYKYVLCHSKFIKYFNTPCLNPIHNHLKYVSKLSHNKFVKYTCSASAILI
uniref:Uncharacterized protein n=1 Tax=Manihot esculenta TaxID=3983 RepID=A0A199UAK7_MANES